MVFIDNKYAKIYFSIINIAKSTDKSDYTEKHHIIPKSLGGSNDPSNIVNLTAKQHYICHLLLTKMTDGSAQTSMRYAFFMMSKKNRYQEGRMVISGRKYEKMKNELRLANKSRPGPNKGKKMSDDVKQKLSLSLKGRKLPPRTKEHSAKLGQYERTNEHRTRISGARKAQVGLQKRSDETKQKMSTWQKGVPKEKFACLHCGKTTSLVNIIRWHNDNCKHR